MSQDSSEEKSLPASDKKLRDARKKGQIAKAPDFASGLAMLVLLGTLWLGGEWLFAAMRHGLDLAAQAAALPDSEPLARVPSDMARLAAPLLLVPLLLSLVAIVLFQVAANRGPIVALEPLKPKLENIDPFKGMKRLFGMRNWVELAKSLVKAALFGVALALGTAGALGSAAQSSLCGLACLAPVLKAALTPLVWSAIAIMLLAGLADLLLQRWLFLREMRMTKTEAKRERKDQDGSPEIKGARSRLRRQATTGERLGLSRAVVLIAGDGYAVGLRYVPGETEVPIVVCRGRGAQAANLMADARGQDIPLYHDPDLAAGLAARTAPGEAVPPPLFKGVATAMFATGVLG